MRKRGINLVMATVLIAAGACSGSGSTSGVVTGVGSNLVAFRATMNGGSEVPATASTGTGTFTATLDTVTGRFIYDVTFTGLSSGVILAHIHGPATITEAGQAALDMRSLPGATFDAGVTSGKGHGEVVLNASTAITAGMNGDSLRKLLFAGLTYANIHTSTNSAGEIRGQIIR